MAGSSSFVLHNVHGCGPHVPFCMGGSFRLPIAAYHPEANGMCQRFHRSLKAGLHGAFLDCNWADQLPWAMFGLYSNRTKDLDTLPAELEKSPLH